MKRLSSKKTSPPVTPDNISLLKSQIRALEQELSTQVAMTRRLRDNIKRHKNTLKALLAEQQYIIDFHMKLLTDCIALEDIIESFTEHYYFGPDDYPADQPFHSMALKSPAITPAPPPFSYAPHDGGIHGQESQPSGISEAVMPETLLALQTRCNRLRELHNIETLNHADLIFTLNEVHGLLKEPAKELHALKKDLDAKVKERDCLLEDYQGRLAGYLKHQRSAGTKHVESHLYEAGNQSSHVSPGTPPAEKTQTLFGSLSL